MSRTENELGGEGGLSERDRVSFYVDLYKQSVETQQHFNDIEWRIRGLALTAATFALGAAGLAAKDQRQVAHFSLGAAIVVVGLMLWYAFYFVDRAWYHPLLQAAVRHGTVIEQELQKSLPAAGMTQAITEGSAYTPHPIVQFLSSNKGYMHSVDKLVWFYKTGAAALVLVALGLQAAALVDQPQTRSDRPVIVKIDPSAATPGPGGVRH